MPSVEEMLNEHFWITSRRRPDDEVEGESRNWILGAHSSVRFEPKPPVLSGRL